MSVSMQSFFPLELLNSDASVLKIKDLHRISHLDPSCVSCGSTNNLSTCISCGLVSMCPSHAQSEDVLRHRKWCKLIPLAEENLGVWNERYRYVFETNASRYFSPTENAVENLKDGGADQGADDHYDQCYECQTRDDLSEWRNAERLKGNMPSWFPLTEDQLELSSWSDIWCLAYTCHYFHEKAAHIYFNILLESANLTLSGPILRKLLAHGRWMLSHGMGNYFHYHGIEESTFEFGKMFYLLALKFNLWNNIEDLSFSPIIVRMFREEDSAPERSDVPGHRKVSTAYQQVRTLAGVRCENLYSNGFLGDYDEPEPLTQKLYSFLNGEGAKHKIQCGVDFIMTRLTMNKPRGWWITGTDFRAFDFEIRLLYILTLKAIADIHAIQEVPSSLGRHQLPAEVILQVQSEVSSNPLILYEPATMHALRFGYDLSPSLKRLEKLGAEVFSRLKQPYKAERHSSRAKDWPELPRLPFFLPLLQPLRSVQQPTNKLFSDIITQTMGASNIVACRHRDIYLQTMAKLQSHAKRNHKNLFLSALQESWSANDLVARVVAQEVEKSGGKAF